MSIILKLFTACLLLLWPCVNDISAKTSPPPKQIVAVFCSADDKVSEDVKQLARNLGSTLASNGYALLTGASKTGLMREVNNGYVENGHPRNLYGFLPAVFKNSNIEHPSIPPENLFWTDTVGFRLTKFRETADAIIVLPGGFGTLHELMDFLVHKQFKLISKPIILLNHNGFWDPFLLQLQVMVKGGYLTLGHSQLFQVAATIEEALIKLTQESVITEGIEDRFWEKNEGRGR